MATKKVNPLEQDAEALDAHLDMLARKFDRLRSMYENYFLGIEKHPPNVARREMNRLMLETQQINISKAAQRFKFQTITQRWVTYIAYWNRTLREIENGTYRRDVARAQRMIEREGSTLTVEQAIALGVPSSRAQTFVDRQNRLIASRRKRKERISEAVGQEAQAGGLEVRTAQAPSREGRLPGVSDSELESFYEAYEKARCLVGDTRPSKSIDELVQRLRPQIERVLRESHASRARLEVSVEDGKVRVRARPVSG